ncbi:MAG: ABC transporter permease subunit [Oscillospiraceae bacterium]
MNKKTKAQEKEVRVRQPLTARRVGDLLLNNALIIIMVIAVIYIAIRNPNFIKPASLINIFSQTAAYLPAALGIGGCIVLTGTDLSAGRAVGLTACISASLLQNAANTANKMWPEIGTLPIPVVILLAMLIGAAIGCFNGLFVAKFKLHPFIVTLGTQLILYTCLLLYVQQGQWHGHLQPRSVLHQLRQGRAVPHRQYARPHVCSVCSCADGRHVVYLEQDHLW